MIRPLRGLFAAALSLFAFSSVAFGQSLSLGQVGGTITLQGTVTFPNLPIFTTCTGYLKGNAASVATCAATVPLSDLAAQAANTIVANGTSGSVAPTALAMPSCSTASSALLWTTSGGASAVTCNTSINAATLGGATFAAPGPIGSGTPGTGAFTTVSATGQFTSTLATGAAPFSIASTTLVPNLYVARAASADAMASTGFANPSASVGLAAVNGSATTAMRSDAAPALSQSIVPTWTGIHTFSAAPVMSLGVKYSGSSSGTVTVLASATAGTPTITWGNTSGTPAATASAPLALSTTTGNLTVTGAAGQVLAGSTPAFTATPTLGVAGSAIGTLALAGNTSGTATITPQATAGSPTLTLPNASGTFAVSATSPVTLSATTGAVGCATCVTSSGGGAITGTAPVAVSAAGAVSITGAAGQVLAGSGPAFTATPTLGVAGSTVGSLAFANATSGSITLQPVTGALGSAVLSLPAATDTLVGKATTDTLTNKTYDTAGTGNTFKINGTTISAVTGSGSAVLATSPTLTTAALGSSTATTQAANDNSTKLATTAYVQAQPVSATQLGGMSNISNALAADVNLNNTGLYFDGPSIAQGTSGTWYVAGSITVLDTGAAASFCAKLWDGTTVIQASCFNTIAASTPTVIAMNGIIATPAANLRISVLDGSFTTGKIRANQSGLGNNSSVISAFRIN